MHGLAIKLEQTSASASAQSFYETAAILWRGNLIAVGNLSALRFQHRMPQSRVYYVAVTISNRYLRFTTYDRMAMRILLVEDDPEISQRIVGRLTGLGFITDHAADAETALTWPQPEAIAAMIVDVGLPGTSGIALIEQWRQRGLRTPILILSARGSWQEKVIGLNAGGDDYVVKPVHAEEVAARLRAIMRRGSGHATSRLSAGLIAIDPSTNAAWLGETILDLTLIEARLLYLLVKHQKRILTWSEILVQLYPGAAKRDRNNVEAHIARLRRKIGRERIVTIRNRGYRLSAD